MKANAKDQQPGIHALRLMASQEADTAAASPGGLGNGQWKRIGRRDWTRTNDPHHVKVVL